MAFKLVLLAPDLELKVTDMEERELGMEDLKFFVLLESTQNLSFRFSSSPLNLKPYQMRVPIRPI